jgi:pyruvate kinase
MMAHICEETERTHVFAQKKRVWEEQGQASVTASIAFGAVQIATQLHASCIVAASLA